MIQSINEENVKKKFTVYIFTVSQSYQLKSPSSYTFTFIFLNYPTSFLFLTLVETQHLSQNVSSFSHDAVSGHDQSSLTM